MAYQKLNWLNKGETGAIPINKDNLNHMDNGIADLYEAIFPIGQIVIKGDNKDYSNWLGFKWERTAVGKVLIGIDSTDTDFNTIGKIGGEKEHTLTIDEMPNHGHAGWYRTVNASGGTYVAGLSDAYDGVAGATVASNTGGSQPHNNIPPYQVVAYWKRIS